LKLCAGDREQTHGAGIGSAMAALEFGLRCIVLVLANLK